MKHRLLTTLTAALLALSAWADRVHIDGINYILDSSTKTASVTYLDYPYTYGGDITIPATIIAPGDGKTYSVTSIGDNAFARCIFLTSITIPNSVTSIGEKAFSGCTGLTSITIPNSVTSIGTGAFIGCKGLTSITIPNSVTTIGSSAFSGCTGLTSITIPNSVTSIGAGAFIGCKGLTSITIPESVTSIGGMAFSGCSGLTSITIGNSVTSIGESAFNDCSGLTSITIPNSVTTIGDRAFCWCTSLTNITIPSSVTSIGLCVFTGCTSLTSIKVEEGNTVYDSRDNCNAIIVTERNSLKIGCMNTTIPISVIEINMFAFSGCTGLTSITIPWRVSEIGQSAFHDCTNLTDITAMDMRHPPRCDYQAFNGLPQDPITLHVPTGCLETYKRSHPWYNFGTIIDDMEIPHCSDLYYIYDDETMTAAVTYAPYKYDSYYGIITIPSSVIFEGRTYSVRSIGDSVFTQNDITSITIPNSVTTIGNSAFSGCTSLTSITIPYSVTSIGDDAFEGCTGLTSINIPNSVTSIGKNAFDYCTGLTSINIPNSVTSIGDWAFYGCKGLTSITIPNSVTSIGYEAFARCTGLTDIYALRTNPRLYNCDTSAFFDVPTSTCTLHVPKGSKEAYAMFPWSEFANIVEDAKPSTEPADLNGDGSVNVGDVTTLVNTILGKEGEDAEGFDLNGDGVVNVGDVTTLVNKILGK